ncbi:hypothetical protein L0337_18260 [candidate division KSB1 bacterium]|nr:hypothetical protein [candidate division KSB1 bacterium]
MNRLKANDVPIIFQNIHFDLAHNQQLIARLAAVDCENLQHGRAADDERGGKLLLL